ncbi:MAG TPA: hydantoinase/oxoprolinase family protein [Planctomycetia bacterium]|nr:hydantoinase/oxoprolinase family protein [Planctomycetia bacterium]
MADQVRQPRSQGRQEDQAAPALQEQQVIRQPAIGLDVGGAGLKAADGKGWAASRRFPLWKSPQDLAGELRRLVGDRPASRIALVTTAELCDCFPVKTDGVRHVIAAVRAEFPHPALHVWNTDGVFVDPDEAAADGWKTGASNFLALAEFAARFCGTAPGLLIDIGSTTADIIPITDGKATPAGRTDPDRLASGELHYEGVERTPLCALRSWATYRGRRTRTMAELFATTRDVYLTLGDLPEDPDDVLTADGKPATREFARDRLARTVGADRTRFSDEDARELAAQMASAQSFNLAAAIRQVISANVVELKTVVVAGQGEWLARRTAAAIPELANAAVVSLSEKLGPEASVAACAHAVATLLDERAPLP